jgi:STE24 endopeptidase
MKIVLACYIALQVAKYLLEFMNIRYMAARIDVVPPEFVGIVDKELLKRTQEYTTETGRFSLVASLCFDVVVVIFMFCGVLDWYNSLIRSLNLPFIAAGWLFLMLVSLANQVISIPFSLYHTFKIEKRYGFNTTTLRLWLSDLIKSLILSVIMLSIVSVVALALVILSPGYWWLWIWFFLLVFSIFVIYVSPSVIDPLFNRFVPLEDNELLREIHRLVDKAGVRISKVLKMDESKRSRHSNAYFSGIGKTKRIVLFDTLLESMDHPQITAVLAHEIGHWKKHHVLKTLIMMQAASFAIFYGGFHLVNSGMLMSLFRISEPTFFANVVITAFLASMVLGFMIPVFNRFSRYFEGESDRYACDLSGKGEALIEALVKLSKENLSNLYPHPLYAAIYYSHPPVLERTREIRRYIGKA